MNRQLPPIVSLLGTHLGLDVVLLQRWWQAVERSRWSECTTWQTELLLYERVGDPEALARTVCAPARLMRVLENLVSEHQLTRRGASQIQEKILALLGPTGAWL